MAGRIARGRRATRLGVAVVVAVCARAPAAAAEAGIWERVADPARAKVDRLVQQAKDLLADVPAALPAGAAGNGNAGSAARQPDNLGQAEALLKQAVALAPFDFSVIFTLGEVQSLRGHEVDAAASFERAEPLARLASQRSSCWFRLGIARSKLGRFRQAVASYDQQIALGEADATAYSNAAELLMALGRLGEAAERYRDAIRIDERATDRRGREQSLAFSYYGLGVALDRSQQEAASREAIGRALALDPGTSLLRLAQQPGADVFFVPDGDVYYYLGLAAEGQGNRDEAGVAFQEYVARQPHSPWMARTRAHLAALSPSRTPGLAGHARAGAAPTDSGAGPGPAAAARGAAWRVAAIATVQAQGPVPAPAIDAALKQRPPGWEVCLAPYPAVRGRDPVRFAVEIELDANGAVARAAAKLPAPFASGGAAKCIEEAVRTHLVVPKPAHGKPTNARVEVLVVGAG